MEAGILDFLKGGGAGMGSGRSGGSKEEEAMRRQQQMEKEQSPEYMVGQGLQAAGDTKTSAPDPSQFSPNMGMAQGSQGMDIQNVMQDPRLDALSRLSR